MFPYGEWWNIILLKSIILMRRYSMLDLSQKAGEDILMTYCFCLIGRFHNYWKYICLINEPFPASMHLLLVSLIKYTWKHMLPKSFSSCICVPVKFSWEKNRNYLKQGSKILICIIISKSFNFPLHFYYTEKWSLQ